MVAAPLLGFLELSLEEWSAAKFAAPDDERIVEETPLLQIPDEGGARGVGILALDFQLAIEVPVLIPAGVHELHETDAPLGETPGHEAVVSIAPLALHVGSVHLQDVRRFIREIGQLGHTCL